MEHGFQVLNCDRGQALAADRVNGAVSILAMSEELDSIGKSHLGLPPRPLWARSYEALQLIAT